MAVMRFAVILCDGGWKVVTERRKLGHFPSREDALAVGAGLALEAEQAGHQSELLLQGVAGELRRLEAAASRSERPEAE